MALQRGRHVSRRLIAITIGAMIALFATAGSAFGAASDIVKVSGVDLFCEFDQDGLVGLLFAQSRDRTDVGSFSFLHFDMGSDDPGAHVLVADEEDIPLTTAGINMTFGVVDEDTGELAGSASLAAAFTGTGAFRAHRVSQDSVQMGLFEDLTVAGSLSVTHSGVVDVFDLSVCTAFGQDRIDQAHHPSGPKPTPPPSNDLPTGATPATVGTAIQEWTGGAATDAEAPCLMTFDGDTFDFPLGRTVWFSITGTGGPITINPRGSDFDTVVAAYASTAAGLESVGCVDDDDVNQTQGSLTIDTVAGTTYLVQIGGVVGGLSVPDDYPQWGRLRVHFE